MMMTELQIFLEFCCADIVVVVSTLSFFSLLSLSLSLSSIIDIVYVFCNSSLRIDQRFLVMISKQIVMCNNIQHVLRI